MVSCVEAGKYGWAETRWDYDPVFIHDNTVPRGELLSMLMIYLRFGGRFSRSWGIPDSITSTKVFISTSLVVAKRTSSQFVDRNV